MNNNPIPIAGIADSRPRVFDDLVVIQGSFAASVKSMSQRALLAERNGSLLWRTFTPVA